MEFNLNIDYAVREADRNASGAARKNNTLTDFLITQAISAKYPPPQGSAVGGIKVPTEQRIAAKLHNSLTKAMNADQDTIELSEDQVEWVAEVLRDWSVPPQWVGWYADLVDYVQEALRTLGERRKAEKNGKVAAA